MQISLIHVSREDLMLSFELPSPKYESIIIIIIVLHDHELPSHLLSLVKKKKFVTHLESWSMVRKKTDVKRPPMMAEIRASGRKEYDTTYNNMYFSRCIYKVNFLLYGVYFNDVHGMYRYIYI